MRKRGLAERERRGGGVLSKSLCSPRGAQSAVGLPYCRELMVSPARYFPLLFQREEGRFVGLVDEERGRKVRIKCPCASRPWMPVTPSHWDRPSRKWHKAALVISWSPLQRCCGRWWISNNTSLPLSPKLSVCLLGPLVPSHSCGSIIAFLVLFNFRISTLKGG